MSENQADLKSHYQNKVVSTLKKKFDMNVMAVPKIEKITLNMGLGDAVADKKVVEKAVAVMTSISGQKPVVTLAKKSVAGFKIRDGMPIGCKVTLRNKKMYEFLTRLLAVAVPVIRDFRGLNPKSFDGRGNFSMGVTELIIFPEVDFMSSEAKRGMDITVTTSAKTDEEARALLTEMGFPFKKKKTQ
jgi:large subunit ribosomal protein L5